MLQRPSTAARSSWWAGWGEPGDVENCVPSSSAINNELLISSVVLSARWKYRQHNGEVEWVDVQAPLATECKTAICSCGLCHRTQTHTHKHEATRHTHTRCGQQNERPAAQFSGRFPCFAGKTSSVRWKSAFLSALSVALSLSLSLCLHCPCFVFIIRSIFYYSLSSTSAGSFSRLPPPNLITKHSILDVRMKRCVKKTTTKPSANCLNMENILTDALPRGVREGN